MKLFSQKIWVLTLLLTIACDQDKHVLDDELTNVDWRVLSIVDKEVNFQMIPLYGYLIRLNKEGQLYYNTDVNNCSASYEHGAEVISIANQSCQERCCDSEFAMTFHSLLSTVDHFKTKGDSLLLRGDKEIVFEKLPSCEGVACQKNWEYIHLDIRTQAGTPPYLTKVVLLRKEDGAILYEHNVLEGYSGFEYTLIEDSFQKTLRNKQLSVSFLGYKNDVLLVSKDFVVTADCCHVSLVEGSQQVVID